MFSAAANTINKVCFISDKVVGQSSTNKSIACKCSDTYTCWNCMRNGAPGNPEPLPRVDEKPTKCTQQ